MKKIRNIFFFLFLVCFLIPELVQSEYISANSYTIEENSKTIQNFLKQQDYFENISGICHEEDCFSIDIHDLTRSLQNIEKKVLEKVQVQYGTEASLEASLKGFSITKILTR